MEPSDGVGLCQCDECKKLGGDSEQAFFLANVVAHAVKKEYPGKMVGLYAYSSHSEPPSFALEPNVYVQLTVGNNYGQFTFDELLDLSKLRRIHPDRLRRGERQPLRGSFNAEPAVNAEEAKKIDQI